MRFSRDFGVIFRFDQAGAWGATLFKKQADNVLIQFFRYTFVGGFAFLVDFSLLYVFTEYLELYYLLSAVLSFFFGLMTNYLLSVAWVFNRRKVGNKWLEFAVFLIIGVIGVGLNVLVIWLGTENLHMHYLFSKLIATVIVYFWNFFARKISLF